MNTQSFSRDDELNQRLYEISIKPVIFRAAEKGLNEISLYHGTFDVYSLSKFLERKGYRTDIYISTFKISWY